MLASNDQAKEYLTPKMGDGWTTTFCASAISGFFAVTLSLPFDFMKTRLQKMKADPITGLMPYRNIGDCFVKALRREGPLAFYSGYPTYYARIAPHGMITLGVVDLLNKLISRKYSSS